MKKLSLFNRSRFFTLLFIIVSVPILPTMTHAGIFYNCTDKRGNASLSDYPVDGMTCTEIQTREETPSVKDENTGAKEDTKKSYKELSDYDFSSDKATKITLIGNKVLIPVTLVYERNETNALLVLDTGASGTTIHANVAEKLYINLGKAQKAKGRVVGGGVIDANMITINSIKVGPYSFYKRNIFIVPYEGPPANYDGLLGMDILQEMTYKLDLNKQAIIWN